MLQTTRLFAVLIGKNRTFRILQDLRKFQWALVGAAKAAKNITRGSTITCGSGESRERDGRPFRGVAAAGSSRLAALPQRGKGSHRTESAHRAAGTVVQVLSSRRVGVPRHDRWPASTRERRNGYLIHGEFMHAMVHHPADFAQVLVHTGQHYDANMSQVFFDELELPQDSCRSARPENWVESGDYDRHAYCFGIDACGVEALPGRAPASLASLNYHVAGFLDDDLGKHGRTLDDVPVLGPVDAVTDAVERFGVLEIFIAVPSATGRQMRRIVDLCKATGISYKTLPGIGAFMNGKVTVKALRDVNYQDLLGRPPVELDLETIRHHLGGKTILVTGAGGSIGSELCRQLVRFHPERLVLVDAGEANLYEIQMELLHEMRFSRHRCLLTRVQNKAVMDKMFRTYAPQVVFHAAAYKHVPMLEVNPWEAVFNNVLGSRVVMDPAARYGAERFVLVSTDKAVRPANVMGASKRTAELLLRFFHETSRGTRFMAVRFGNVLGSSGSVLPLFTKQIERGGPVTVTHPEVTRYFITIPEAAQLILQAASLGQGGEIFALEMGTPVKIAQMLESRISGLETSPNKRIDDVNKRIDDSDA